ncbi:putative toxin-antitoxin system toxin component, PIN family [Hymenobacter sp. BRD67]|uniref:putative toxin-antitoxin system toxin component, PIN family n=1 Tax=Hymenobacter sp. BRD67 TaxID=2675877 RepID=UPI0020B7249F|nr:putative toxin-antitoxin system toxin component, PIN family [Hymenobacter sp. BRD67]
MCCSFPSRRAPVIAGFFDALLDKRFTLCVTTEILLEYGEIIARQMGDQYFYDTMMTLENLANLERVTPRFRFNLLHDPDDNKFVDCAIAANAVCIVSHDRDFLPLRAIEFPKVAVVDTEVFRGLLSL